MVCYSVSIISGYHVHTIFSVYSHTLVYLSIFQVNRKMGHPWGSRSNGHHGVMSGVVSYSWYLNWFVITRSCPERCGPLEWTALETINSIVILCLKIGADLPLRSPPPPPPGSPGWRGSSPQAGSNAMGECSSIQISKAKFEAQNIEYTWVQWPTINSSK